MQKVEEAGVERTLTSLADEINSHHERADAATRNSEQANRDAVGAAIQPGLLLLEAKRRVGYGLFLRWLRMNFRGSTRLAQVYMRLANRAPEAQRVAHLGIRGADRELRDRDRAREGRASKDPAARITRVWPRATVLLLEELQHEHARLVDAVLDVERGVLGLDELVELARRDDGFFDELAELAGRELGDGFR